MSGVTLSGRLVPKLIPMNEMQDGQLAVVESCGKVVQCFDSTDYGANKVHWVVIGHDAGESYSRLADNRDKGPSMMVRVLEKGETLTVK